MQNLRQGKMSSHEMYHTIHEFGRENFLEARPVIESFLTSEDAQLHSIALEVAHKPLAFGQALADSKRFS